MLPVSIIMKAEQFLACLSTKSLKVIFPLVSFLLIMISMVRINVLECWYIFFVWPISPVSTMLVVLVELVCILK